MSQLNSQMKLILPADLSVDIDPSLRDYVVALSNAIQQQQAYIEQFLGVTQKLYLDWGELTPQDTLLEHQLNRLYLITTEGIAYGELVNLFNSAGELKARLAKANTNAKPAMGFCSVAGGAGAGTHTEITLLRGLCVGAFAGLTPGARYFLDAASFGSLAAAEPVAAGNIGQFVGIAVSGTDLLFDINSQYVQH